MTTPKVKTIFDDQKLKLTAKPIEQGARPPTFQVSTYRNNPQFTVYTNHDNGSGVTWISDGNPGRGRNAAGRLQFWP